MTSSRRQDALALATIWIAAVAFFWPLVSGASALYFRDTLSHYIPQALLTAAAWRDGGPPLWEPLLGLGYPLATDPHSMAFYPPALLMRVLPFPLSYSILVCVHLPLGGSFLYGLARRYGLQPPAALLAALAFMFNGYSITTVALSTLLKGLTWAPLAVLCFDMYLGGGRCAWIAAAAASLAIAGAGTDPQYVLFAGGLVALAPLMRPEPSPRSVAAIVAGVASVGALAGLMLAYQYLPLAQLIGQSDRRVGLGAVEVGLFPIEPLWLLSMLVPTAFPDPADPRFLLSFPRTFQVFFPDVYFGAPLIALAFGAAGAGRRRTATTLLVLTSVALVLSLGEAGGLFTLLNRLIPPLQAFRFASKYFLLVGFGLPLAAGLGFQGLVEGRTAARRVAGAALIAAAATYVALLVAVGRAPQQLAAQFLETNPAVDPATLPELGELAARWSSRLTTALAVTSGALALVALQRRPRVLLWSLLALLMLGDLVMATRGSVALAPAAALAQPPAAAALLAPIGAPAPRYATYFSGHLNYARDRTAAGFYRDGRELMRYLSGAAYGLDPLFAASSVRLAWESPLVDLMSTLSAKDSARVLANLGTTHFVGLGQPGVGIPSGRAGAVAVERLPDAAPRAFVPPRAHASAAASAPTSAALLALREDAVYEPSPGLPATLSPTAVRRCALKTYARYEIGIDVEVEGEGLLVVLDSWYPGWVARVDGSERAIARVAGMVRGIPVRTGDRSVVLTFEPRAFRTGAAISVCAVLVAALMLAWPAFRKSKTAPAP